ncbi:hypothetical protein ES703_53428 [subsurface metagenome]
MIRGTTLKEMADSQGFIQTIIPMIPTRVMTFEMACKTPDDTREMILSMSFVALETTPPTSLLA